MSGFKNITHCSTTLQFKKRENADIYDKHCLQCLNTFPIEEGEKFCTNNVQNDIQQQKIIQFRGDNTLAFAVNNKCADCNSDCKFYSENNGVKYICVNCPIINK